LSFSEYTFNYILYFKNIEITASQDLSPPSGGLEGKKTVHGGWGVKKEVGGVKSGQGDISVGIRDEG